MIDESDVSETEWMNFIGQAWAELSDPREDIYTLADGNAVSKIPDFQVRVQ